VSADRRHPYRRTRWTARGQALAEFALVAPVFFLLLLGIIEAGRFIFHYEMLNNAARGGARYAIIHGSASGNPTGPGSPDPTGSAIRQAVSDSSQSLIGLGQLTFPTPATCDGTAAQGICWSAFPNGGTNDRGTTVRLTVEFTYSPVVPVLPPITVSAEASGVINN
jgi:Flp pilus assembly protein TadG